MIRNNEENEIGSNQSEYFKLLKELDVLINKYNELKKAINQDEIEEIDKELHVFVLENRIQAVSKQIEIYKKIKEGIEYSKNASELKNIISKFYSDMISRYLEFYLIERYKEFLKENENSNPVIDNNENE